MKITIKLRKPDEIWDKYIQKLEKYADVKIIYDNGNFKLDDCEILITTNLTIELLNYMPNLKEIYLFKTGTDKLPLDEIKQRGICVYASHANADIIAEHAVALCLTLLHKITEEHNKLSKGIWLSGKKARWVSLSRLNVGILGYGAIGKALYNKINALCKSIMVLNKNKTYSSVKYADSLAQLIAENDVIFICVPRNNETQGMFNKEVLKEMKGKYVINVSRAEICEEKALYEALKDGVLAGYAADVWFNEPNKSINETNVMPSKYPFWEFNNVVMSPHSATHEINAHERYIKDACNMCINHIKEKKNGSF